MPDEIVAISFKLPDALRQKIKEAAKAEERSESGYLRFHLGEMFKMSEAESAIADDAETTTPES